MTVGTLKRLLSDMYQTGAFVAGLLKDYCTGVRIPRDGLRRMALVTRMDIFPANHGGAVKIVQTARSLSFHYDEVVVVTQSNEMYYVFRHGVVEEHRYPFLVKWGLWKPLDSLREAVKSAGFPPCDEWMALPLYDSNFKLRTLFLTVRRPFEIIQAEFATYIFATQWMAKVYPDIITVGVEHNVEFNRVGATYEISAADIEKMKQLEIRACNTCDHVVAVSDVDREIFIKNGVDPARLSVIPLGVDLTEYVGLKVGAAAEMRKKLGFSPSDYILIFHGVLSYKPNYDAVCLLSREIMPRLREMGVPAKCLLVGLYPPVELAADDIVMTGPVDRLPPYIQAADVAVVPLLDGGGTRLKILEYFAAGVPVISTAKGAEGIKAEPGKDILIEDSMGGIADLLEKLWKNPAERKKIGDSGRDFTQQFGWDRLAEDYLAVYSHCRRLKERKNG